MDDKFTVSMNNSPPQVDMWIFPTQKDLYLASAKVIEGTVLVLVALLVVACVGYRLVNVGPPH